MWIGGGCDFRGKLALLVQGLICAVQACKIKIEGVRGSSVEATMGDADMSRRRKTKPADLTLDKLTWLFAGLIILAAVAGVIGGVAR